MKKEYGIKILNNLLSKEFLIDKEAIAIVYQNIIVTDLKTKIKILEKKNNYKLVHIDAAFFNAF